MQTLASDRVHLRHLTAPYVSRREEFPALHLIAQGVSPWTLGDDPELVAANATLSWTVVSFGRSTPSHVDGVIATETEMVVEVKATKRDGTIDSLGNRSCVLRTELDAGSLADRQRTQQGWLLPVGYTIVVDLAA